MKRHATAVWNGTGKEGKGHLTTQSGILEKTQYSFSSRFENGAGTNPEELVAAAHAGCFAMKLSFNLQEAGYNPTELHAQCHITLEDGKVSQSHIKLKATIDGIEKDEFDRLVKDAEDNCPISRLLDTDIQVEAHLNA
jgi:osmotically inducible protein OsmC